MEHKGSLPCSQHPTTGSQAVPVVSSQLRRLFFSIHFNIILPATPNLPNGSSVHVFQPKFCVRFLLFP